MAENLTVARPYAKAAYEFAKEHNCVDSWQNLLQGMSVVCSDSVMLQMLKNAASPESAAAMLCELMKGLSDEHGNNFIAVLSSNNRFEVVPEIYTEFVKLREQDERVLDAVLTSARPLSKDECSALSDKLEQKYKCKVHLTTALDPSLIGGAVLKIGDEVIDASVKTSLERLSATLR